MYIHVIVLYNSKIAYILICSFNFNNGKFERFRLSATHDDIAIINDTKPNA